MAKSRSRGWKFTRAYGDGDNKDTAIQCLDCGWVINVYADSNAIVHMLAVEAIAHDERCVPGKDTTPTGPIGLAFGMSIQLRDLFVMAQLSAKNNVIVTGNDAAFMYANADRMLAERDKDK
jgi:hypothetical protein